MKLINKISFILAALISASFFQACGDKEDEGETTTSFKIPTITGAVTTSALTALQSRAATTGQDLSDDGTWAGNNDAGEAIYDMTKQFLTMGSGPDSMMCRMQAMYDTGVVPSMADGTYKYIYADAGIEIKMKLAAAASGGVGEFEMFLCFGGTPAQMQYVSYSTASGAPVFNVKVVQSGMGFQMGATGTLNSSGAWTSKNVTMKGLMTVASDTMSMNMDFNQYADSVIFKGTMFMDTATTDDTMKLYSKAQLIGPTSGKYFLGDGSAKANFSGTQTFDGITSWNGDTGNTLSDVTSGDHYTAVSSGTFLDPHTTAITFSGADAWDCVRGASAVDIMATAASNSAFATAMNACDEAYPDN